MMSLHVAKTNDISIHAAREGGDRPFLLLSCCRNISIHAAREGGDAFQRVRELVDVVFQSTPPVKAATQPFFRQKLEQYFNPRRP